MIRLVQRRYHEQRQPAAWVTFIVYCGQNRWAAKNNACASRTYAPDGKQQGPRRTAKTGFGSKDLGGTYAHAIGEMRGKS